MKEVLEKVRNTSSIETKCVAIGNEQTEILFNQPAELIAEYHQMKREYDVSLSRRWNLRTEANQDVTSNFK